MACLTHGALIAKLNAPPAIAQAAAEIAQAAAETRQEPVSYTHLTLPTIYSV